MQLMLYILTSQTVLQLDRLPGPLQESTIEMAACAESEELAPCAELDKKSAKIFQGKLLHEFVD